MTLTTSNNRKSKPGTKFLIAAPIAFYAFWAHPALSNPVQTTTSIEIAGADSGVRVSNPANISAKVAVSNPMQDGDLIGGKLLLRMAVDKNGTQISCDSLAYAGDAEVAQLDPVNSDLNTGAFSVNWQANTSLPGSFGYSASYLPSSPNYAPSQSACVNLVVEDEPCPPSSLSLNVNRIEGEKPAYPGDIFSGRYQVLVKNCGTKPVTGVTVESKNNDWARITGFSQEPGTSAITEQPGSWDQTIRWTIGEIPEKTAMKLTVVVEGSIPAETTVGTILPLGSKWTVKNADGDITEADNLANVTVEAKPK
jgi:hypothetical protein